MRAELLEAQEAAEQAVAAAEQAGGEASLSRS